MQTALAVLALAVTVFLGLVALMSFDFTREWVGLGDVAPTGVPGWVAGFIGG